MNNPNLGIFSRMPLFSSVKVFEEDFLFSPLAIFSDGLPQIDFIGNSNFSATVVFSRSSAGTYDNSLLEMQTAGVEVARFTYG